MPHAQGVTFSSPPERSEGGGRGGGLLLLLALAACDRPAGPATGSAPASAASPGSTHRMEAPDDAAPPAGEARVAGELRSGACEGLRMDDRRPGLWAGRCGGREVVLTLATREDPQRWRPAAALHRLDRGLGFGVVATTVRRELSLRELAGAVGGVRPQEAEAMLASLAVKADGTVTAAVVAVPGATRLRATRWSREEQVWTRLVEGASEPSAAQASEADGWVKVLVLDYLAASILRRTVEQDESGHLWLVDNRVAFVEHPESYALEQQLARLRRVQRWPAGLEAVGRLDERRLAELLAPGEYDEWLVHRRARGEVAIRARALGSWLRAQGVVR